MMAKLVRDARFSGVFTAVLCGFATQAHASSFLHTNHRIKKTTGPIYQVLALQAMQDASGHSDYLMARVNPPYWVTSHQENFKLPIAKFISVFRPQQVIRVTKPGHESLFWRNQLIMSKYTASYDGNWPVAVIEDYVAGIRSISGLPFEPQMPRILLSSGDVDTSTRIFGLVDAAAKPFNTLLNRAYEAHLNDATRWKAPSKLEDDLQDFEAWVSGQLSN